MARVRMGALAVAFGLQHDLDLECLVHFTTRDRNLMALESELLGAHALDVRNILALTGDPPRVGDYPTGTGIWDVDSVGLIGILTRLNRGRGSGRQANRLARWLHDRLRTRPHGRRPGPRDGAPERQDRGRGQRDHDPADLRLRAMGPLHARQRPRDGRAGCRGRCCWASCRCTPIATPSSCTTRCPASRFPTRCARPWQRPASVAPRWAWRWPTRCWRR